MLPIIVGIDPGTTSAFAAMDFDFNILKVKSKRNYSFAELLSDIYKVGYPVIAGSDKKDMPALIKEFSQKTGSTVFCPSYDTKKSEKKYLVKEKGFDDLVKNAHETDALASAIYAYNEYKDTIKKIKKFALAEKKEKIIDKLIVKVINEEKSISKAVKEIEKKPRQKPLIVKKKHKILEKKELTKEEKEIKLLKEQNTDLKKKLKKLKKENRKLRNKKIDIDKETKKIISFKEKRALKLDRENKKLRKKIKTCRNEKEKLNEFIADSSKYTIIVRFKNLSHEEFKKKKRYFDTVKSKIILVDNIAVYGRKTIEDTDIKIIIYKDGSNSDLKENFTVVKNEDMIYDETEDFALIKRQQLEKVIAKVRKSKDYLRNIVTDYKKERLKEIY